MDENPYEILGVTPDASADAVQKAYRRLAKKLHPDLNPGNCEAEDQFKRVAGAYGLLGDPEKRARFDRGEIDASGVERQQHPFYRDYAGAAGEHDPYTSAAGFADFADSDDILSEILRRRSRAHVQMSGADVHYRLPVEFLEAVNGANKLITLPDGTSLELKIPPGAHDGQVLRLRGKGEPGIGGGAAGNALVEIEVRPHKFFSRDGDDIRAELPVSLTEAVLGAEIRVPTPTGPVTMTVPSGANTRSVLRLRGKGVVRQDGSRGDEYITLKVVLPKPQDPELEAFARNWAAGKTQNVRQDMET